MKIKNMFLKTLSILFLVLLTHSLQADTPPPTPPGAHGQAGNQAPEAGGGAPIDGGVTILLVLGAVYGTKKIFAVKKDQE